MPTLSLDARGFVELVAKCGIGRRTRRPENKGHGARSAGREEVQQQPVAKQELIYLIQCRAYIHKVAPPKGRNTLHETETGTLKSELANTPHHPPLE